MKRGKRKKHFNFLLYIFVAIILASILLIIAIKQNFILSGHVVESCFDSDGKDNFFVGGYVNQISSDNVSHKVYDECFGNISVDYYCPSSSGNGTGFKDDDRFLGGTGNIISNPTKKTTKTPVTFKPAFSSTSKDCTTLGGYKCSNGACIADPLFCDDSDGVNPCKLGSVSITNAQSGDYCKNADTVVEKTCGLGYNGIKTISQTEILCANRCNNGACDACLPPDDIVEVFPGQNDIWADRVNIFFYYNKGMPTTIDEYYNTPLFYKNLSQFLFFYRGIRVEVGAFINHYPVIKENVNKFNFWVVRKPLDLSCKDINPHDGGKRTSAHDLKLLATPIYITPNGDDSNNIIIFCEENPPYYFGAYAWLGEGVVVRTPGPIHELYNDFGDTMHEFLHAFASAADETVDTTGAGPHYPNCAGSFYDAREWWGDLLGNHTTYGRNSTVGFYLGCSDSWNNIRPMEQSIMGNGGSGNFMGPVIERHMRNLLSQYSGIQSSQTNYIQMELVSSGSDFSVASVVEKRGYVHPREYEDKYKLEFTSSTSKSTQYFNDKEFLMYDNIDSDGKIIGGGSKTSSKSKITINIPIGQSKIDQKNMKIVSSAGMSNDFTISITNIENGAKTLLTNTQIQKEVATTKVALV
jgi:hypothetical protein